MPMLDVSFVLSDPMLADTFQVDRREDVVGSNGRTTPTIVETFEEVVGVVTQQSPSDLMRKEEGQLIPRRIFIASTFAFRGPSKVDGVRYQPDLITWDGTEYIVTEVLPYSRYGLGTYEVIAESKSAIDEAQ